MINVKRKVCYACLFWLSVSCLHAQSLTIEEAYKLAREHYPLAKQRDLIARTRDFSIANAAKGYLPQVSILGQASYQSAVTEFNLPVAAPGLELPRLSKDQYRIYADVSQTIYDGGAVKTQVAVQKVNALLEEQKLETELYKLEERINQVFFGLLLIDAQMVQTTLLKADIGLNIRKMQAFIDNGTALKSNLNILKAELLKAEQRHIELHANRRAYLDVLGLLVNQTLGDSAQLVRPQPVAVRTEIDRPELRVFEVQNQQLGIQSRLLDVRNRPRLSLFAQGGFGRPALNILSNSFDPYYIAGVRVNWSLAGFYTLKNDRQLIAANRNAIMIQKETFLYNTSLTTRQQSADLVRLQQLIATDEELVNLREDVRKSAAAQLENGTINSGDYLRELNAEDQAKQNQSLHEIQLLLAQYTLQFTTGKKD